VTRPPICHFDLIFYCVIVVRFNGPDLILFSGCIIAY
jgi:hypothetical protein